VQEKSPYAQRLQAEQAQVIPKFGKQDGSGKADLERDQSQKQVRVIPGCLRNCQAGGQMKAVEIYNHPIQILAEDPEAIFPKLSMERQVKSRLPREKGEIVLV
jgi:hypothetical protein